MSQKSHIGSVPRSPCPALPLDLVLRSLLDPVQLWCVFGELPFALCSDECSGHVVVLEEPG